MECNTCETTFIQEIKPREIKPTQDLKRVEARVRPKSEIPGTSSTHSIQRADLSSSNIALSKVSTHDAERVDSVSRMNYILRKLLYHLTL